MNKKGQALVESVIIFYILLLFLAGIVQFGQYFLTLNRLQTATQYGALLKKNGTENEIVVKKMKKYLSGLQSNRLNIEITSKSISAYYPSKSIVVNARYKFYPVKLLRKIVPELEIKDSTLLTIDPWYFGKPGSKE